jgi:spermidine/putrescine transport system substrate-binding protein
MKPGMATLIAETYGYATPNKAALKTLDLWVKGSQIVYPGDEILKKAHIHLDVDAALPVYQKYWKLLRQKK